MLCGGNCCALLCCNFLLNNLIGVKQSYFITVTLLHVYTVFCGVIGIGNCVSGSVAGCKLQPGITVQYSMHSYSYTLELEAKYGRGFLPEQNINNVQGGYR